MYSVRSKSGRAIRRFATRQEAETFVRQAAHSPSNDVRCRACGGSVTPKSARSHADELLKDARRAYDIGDEDLARELRAEATAYLGMRAGMPRNMAQSPTGAMTRAEAKRRGELAGAAHADGWIDRNRPGRKELESAIVSQSNRQGWADTARSLSYDKGIYGGGARVEADRKAFVDGYVEAILKELKREYGRQGSPIRNPRPASRGFIVVATRTGEILSPLFKNRAQAREALLARLAVEGTPTKMRPDDVEYQGGRWARSMGVHQVMLYPNEAYNSETYRP